MQFASRMQHFEVGVFSKLGAMRREAVNAGKIVTDLSVGTPNIPPAPHILKVITEAVADPKNYIYAISDTMDLRRAAADWYQRRYQVSLDPATEITSLLGSQDGLSHLALTLVDPGDIVLVPDPSYPVFRHGPLLAGAELYYMPQKPENNWIIDVGAIPEDIARRAKLMVISYPNNPVTRLAPDSFYHEVIAFAKKYDIAVLHDNAYGELIFDGKTGKSFLCYEGARDVGIEFNSLSKTYGMAGARVGFAFGNPEMIGRLIGLKSNLDYGIFLPIQQAAIAALSGPQDCVATTRAAYQSRRNILADGLTSIGWPVERCEATMFLWPKIPEKFSSSEEFTFRLFESTGVLVTPGSAFGPSGEGYVRMALVQSEKDIRDAIERIDQSGILK